MKYLTPGQVADRLGTSKETVRRWCRTGQLPAIRFGSGSGSSLRIEERDFDAWLAKQRPANS